MNEIIEKNEDRLFIWTKPAVRGGGINHKHSGAARKKRALPPAILSDRFAVKIKIFAQLMRGILSS